jgi:high-affinity nickel permease
MTLHARVEVAASFGYAIVGIFLAAWFASVLVYRAKGLRVAKQTEVLPG